jgi:hypothetical protein
LIMYHIDCTMEIASFIKYTLYNAWNSVFIYAKMIKWKSGGKKAF